jgi:Spy/CpxP family protein refolding chaperone
MQPGMMGPGMMHPRMMQNQHKGNSNFRHDGAREHKGFGLASEGMWWKNPMVVQRLALTPDQTKKMDDIFQKSRLQLIDLKANVEKQNALLDPLLSANPPDTTKALIQIDKVADARADLEKASARMLFGIREVLTPDQWAKLHEGHGPGGFSPQGGFGGKGFGPHGDGGMNHIVEPAPQQ